jgi:hypothetical protein
MGILPILEILDLVRSKPFCVRQTAEVTVCSAKVIVEFEHGRVKDVE